MTQREQFEKWVRDYEQQNSVILTADKIEVALSAWQASRKVPDEVREIAKRLVYLRSKQNQTLEDFNDMHFDANFLADFMIQFITENET
jgi:glycine cleavage system pyridoxal-binding protein P